jgi:hypothetical protein
LATDTNEDIPEKCREEGKDLKKVKVGKKNADFDDKK